MKVKVKIFFEEVESEIEIPDNLDKEEIENELNNKISELEEKIKEKTEISYFEEV